MSSELNTEGREHSVSGEKVHIDLPGVEELLGIHFGDQRLGQVALSPWSMGFSRLEFLGDAVMGLAVISTAEMTGVARTTAISRVANRHLDEVFRTRFASHTPANTGDVIEALVGAVHLDRGYDSAASIALELCLPEAAARECSSATSDLSSVSERGLAFIGAAVLSASAADDLCLKYPTRPHRWLSEERSTLLSRRHLAAVSAALGYAPEGDPDDEVYRATASDALEAVLGEQFVRWGWEEARVSSTYVMHWSPGSE